MKSEKTPLETLKAALISIVIGACISIITVLFQYGVEWLNSIEPEVPGVIAGIARYLHLWNKQFIA